MESDDLKREIEALRARSATLNAAILRINASLDLDAVLREVVDSARALTGAQHGVIAAVDTSGEPRDVVTSGLTPDEHRLVLDWSDGLRVFEHLRDLPGPLRVTDLPGFVRSLGVAADLVWSKTLLATPMRHHDEHVGHFFLAGKEGAAEFTDEDEEILVLFASQAASAIANARIHRGERRVQGRPRGPGRDLSGRGRWCLDAQTGRAGVDQPRGAAHRGAPAPCRAIRPSSSWRCCPSAAPTGSEASLGESPDRAVCCSSGETVRAEEVVLSVPDGRSVRALGQRRRRFVPTGDGIASVVVTLQDLAPLDEIERLRTEFLGLVSHELREPLAAIKGSATTLLEDSAALDPAEMREFHRIIFQQSGHMRGLIGDLLDAGRIDTGTLSVSPEPSELAELVERARDTFVGGGGRHGIAVDLPVGLPRVNADRRRVVQVLNNLFANAARHAPESSPIRVAALREDGHVEVSVSDEGRGVAPELLPRLFDKHAGEGSKAGYGLGLAICKGLVEAHGGRIRAESAGPGLGATVTFTLPVAGEGGVEAVADAPTAPPSSERARILVVDDDPRTLRSVRNTLTAAGYAPLVTGEPGELAQIIRSERPRLVLLDLVMPGKDGIELMEQVPELSDLPVIFISGYGRDETVAAALESGAADYIVKPFSATELVARVRAALRRHEEPEPFMLGDLAIDYGRRRVTVAGAAVDLTATEFELLRVLCAQRGTGRDLRDAAAPGLERARRRQLAPGAHLRAHAAPQARRGRRQPRLDLQRARRRLPHGRTRGGIGKAAAWWPPACTALGSNRLWVCGFEARI